MSGDTVGGGGPSDGHTPLLHRHLVDRDDVAGAQGRAPRSEARRLLRGGGRAFFQVSRPTSSHTETTSPQARRTQRSETLSICPKEGADGP